MKSIKIQSVLLILGISLMAMSVLPTVFEVIDKQEFVSEDKVISARPSTDACEVLKRPAGRIDLEVRFIPNTLRNYQNVFQSDDLNQGIRLEIDELGSVAAIIRAQTTDFLMVGSDTRVTIGNEHTARIVIRRDSSIAMSLDESKWINSPGVPAPLCRRWLLGQGFDKTRQFDGISTLTIKSGYERDRIPSRRVVRIVGQVLLFGAVLWWSMSTKQKDNRLTA